MPNDDMHFGFMPAHATTYAIFLVTQLQEKHTRKKKKSYIAFVALQKAFDRIPREVVW